MSLESLRERVFMMGLAASERAADAYSRDAQLEAAYHEGAVQLCVDMLALIDAALE